MTDDDLQAVNQLACVPLVLSLYGWLGKWYSRVKQANFITRIYFTVCIELSLVLAHKLIVRPILGRLTRLSLVKKGLVQVDSFVCNELSAFEHRFPTFFTVRSVDEIKLGAYLVWQVRRVLMRRFKMTKDKIELYKEYLNVVARQFTVQDGRSLHSVASLEERTKIILRRSVGNLLTACHLVRTHYTRLEPLIRQKLKRLRSLDKCELIRLVMSGSLDKLDYWFVPHFDAFGVISPTQSQPDGEHHSDSDESVESSTTSAHSSQTSYYSSSKYFECNKFWEQIISS